MSDESGRTPPSRASQADFIAGLAIGLIALLILVDSIRMPFYEEGKRGFLSAPGLTPGLLSLGLLVMSIMLVVRARGFRFQVKGYKLTVETGRILAVVAILIAYVAAIRPLGYVWSTFVMLAVFQFVFMERRTVRHVLLAVFGLSAVVTAALYYLFAKVFLIPIP